MSVCYRYPADYAISHESMNNLMKILFGFGILAVLATTACTIEAGAPPRGPDRVIVAAPAPRPLIVHENFADVDLRFEPPRVIVPAPRPPFVIEHPRHREWRRDEYRPGYRGNDWRYNGGYGRHDWRYDRGEHRGW